MAYGMMKAKYPESSEDAIWDKIGLVDTEHKRALVYEGRHDESTYNVRIGQFWHYNLQKPYSLDHYKKAVKEIKNAGAEVVVIDSLSHAWQGEGGILEYQQELGGRYQDWKQANKDAYFPLVSLAVGEMFDIHTINTIRSKQAHTMQTTETGKQEVVKLGLQPVQRDDFEYEFQIVFNTDMQHVARTTKDNSGLFEGKPNKITPEHGRRLFDWLEKGADVRAEEKAQQQEFISMINQMIEVYGEPVKKAVEAIENHKSVAMKIEHMPLDWLEKTYNVANMKVKEIESSKETEVAEA
jgi:hypothetical protein